jgi:hypothetical protein
MCSSTLRALERGKRQRLSGSSILSVSKKPVHLSVSGLVELAIPSAETRKTETMTSGTAGSPSLFAVG